ncbi:hypothetical protein BC477_01040 [Clavibacter michiganensis subsp. michiganensis]|uniref:Uncharacterized protein n=1 Tax=Clavibacter michiganensis subsp. michiganensis TaxID=33013 RepID=A0A251XFK7_CLAMM|nr:hypothetical protein BC477_01040 [Clavibacter michiganensis subsp. michiganensis]OUE00838.1 hypothetical protein CMMCAS07_15480 [Clavibacter michiganensis subsp. michiganensis]
MDTQQTRRTDEAQEGSRWRVVYARRLALSDAIVIILTTFGVQFLWFGTTAGTVDLGGNAQGVAVTYTMVSVVLILAWLFVLTVYSTRDYRIVGTGTQEYKQVADATLRLFGIIAIVAFLVKIDLARGYIVTGLPLGLVLLLLSRTLWRVWLSAQRRRGEFSSLILLVGSLESTTHTATTLARAPKAGYRVVGACLTGDARPSRLPGLDVPVVGNADDALVELERLGADTLVLTSSDELPPERIASSAGRSSPAATTSSWLRGSPTSAARASTPARSPASRSSTWRRRASRGASSSPSACSTSSSPASRSSC